jgi:hypothetical protein
VKKKIAPKKKDQHYWSTLEMNVTLSGANVFTSQDAVTGVAVDQRRIMLVKKIALSYNIDIGAAPAPGIDFAVFAALSTQQGLAAMPALQDAPTIYFHAWSLTLGGDGATAAESPGFASVENGMPAYVEFDDPLPIADNEITFYLDSTALATAISAAIKIWYAPVIVSFEDALMILESYR